MLLRKIEDAVADIPCRVEDDTGQMLLAMEPGSEYDAKPLKQKRKTKR